MLAKVIRAKMGEQRLSYEDLSRKSGVSKGYLWQLVNQEGKSPGIIIAKSIATALGCGIDDLLGGNVGTISAWDPKHVVSCARCRLTQGLNMFAHRDEKNMLIGFMFLCKGCADIFGGATVELKFDKPFMEHEAKMREER